MKRAALYARFSSDLQQERSIEDQVVLCRSFAEKCGLEIVEVFSDRARSGASIMGRDGLMQMMDAARDRRFDVVLTESLDRLSRDQEDLAGLWKRLNFLGIDLQAVHGGLADQIQIGVRGLLGSLYLTDLAQKVRRGMQGVVREGRSAGGRAYGYAPVPGKPGELSIVEHEAEVVRRIFNDYLAGETPREIAHALNRDQVPPPRGQHWTASAINGNKKRHHGILLNELYCGSVVWNRVRMVKDPDTGKRVSRPNPPDEWKRSEAQHLAIIDKEIFGLVQARKASRSHEQPETQRKASRSHEQPETQRKARYLLSGLLKCGCCGGGLAVKDRDHGRLRLQCSVMREAGTCSNRRSFYMDEIEKLVLDGLQKHLTAPHLLKVFAEEYFAERNRLSRNKQLERNRSEKKIQELDRAIARVWQDYEREIIDGTIAGPKLKVLHDQKKALEAELAVTPEPELAIGLHPGALAQYEKYVCKLQSLFNQGITPDLREAAGMIQNLVARVIVVPREKSFTIEIKGRLSLLLEAPPLYPSMRLTASGGTVVAGEGVEPPTPGL